ncbi:uncharacterized protein LOC135811399 [Sycon ciliatum]|uniref:uncharacterized protein LOC135811399 n=1 Tax=Sycon ciliatum TaxID=27933 RepID=UPI0031F6E152
MARWWRSRCRHDALLALKSGHTGGLVTSRTVSLSVMSPVVDVLPRRHHYRQLHDGGNCAARGHDVCGRPVAGKRALCRRALHTMPGRTRHAGVSTSAAAASNPAHAVQRRAFVMTAAVKYLLTPWLRKQRNKVNVRRLNEIGAEMLCAEWAMSFAQLRPQSYDQINRTSDPVDRVPSVLVCGSVSFHGIPHVYCDVNFLPRPRPFAHYNPLVVEMVNCSHMEVTDGGLRHVVFLSRLRELRLSHCQFVTNRGMVHVAGVARTLRRLAINGCRGLSEDCIASISRLQHLERLDVRETALVAHGAHLRRALPPSCELIV